MMGTKTIWNLAAGLAISALFLPAAQAGGIVAGENGTQGLARAGAFVAKADDPTALYYNPAGLAKSRRLEFFLGSNLLDYSLTYDRYGSAEGGGGGPDGAGSPATYDPIKESAGGIVLPYFGASQRFGKLALGQGMWGPPAVALREFGDAGVTSPGRYDVIEQDAVIAMPSFGVAYRVLDQLDVGVRATWGFASVKGRTAVWGLENDSEDPAFDGIFSLDTKDSFVPSFGAGVLYRPSNSWELGLAYRSEVAVRAKGAATAVLGMDVPATVEPVADAAALCGPGGTSAALVTCLGFNLPQTVTLGGRFIVRDGQGRQKADVEIDVKWENWSKASTTDVVVDAAAVAMLGGAEIPLRPTETLHGFRDTFGVRVGGSYRFGVGENKLELRGGVGFDSAAAPTSWSRIDQDGKERVVLGSGIAYELAWLRVDVAAGYIWEPTKDFTDVPLAVAANRGSRVQPDVIVPDRIPRAQPYHPFNAGRYESSYFTAGLSLTAWFE